MQKIETWSCRWKSNNYNNINIFLSLENPCTCLLAKEKTWKYIFNTNSELLQNRTEKQTMSSKTTANWLFNDIWCYLFIAYFEWKISVFQQTVVRVYYILNTCSQHSMIQVIFHLNYKPNYQKNNWKNWNYLLDHS